MSYNAIKISIIVPVYNVEEFLEQAIDSLINQTMKDIEIICVEDCSKDNCRSILREYAKKDKRITLIENDVNKGQGYSSNIALDIAKGDYIMYLDPDDWYELDACETAYNHITKYNNDIVFFNRYIYSEKYNKRFIDDKFGEKLDLIKDNPNANIYNSPVPLSGFCFTKIYNRKFLIDNNCRFTETRCAEDFIFAVTTNLYAKSVSVLNKPLYTYRTLMRDNKYRKNVLNSRIEKFNDSFENRKIVYDFIRNRDLGMFNDELMTYWINSSIDCCFYYAKNNKKHAKEIYEYSKTLIESVIEEYDINKLPTTVNLKKLRRLLRYKHWWQYNLMCNILPSVFYVKNYARPKKVHKVVNILGIKMKFQKNIKKNNTELLGGGI